LVIATTRTGGAGASFGTSGTGKAIFAYGINLNYQVISLSNIISNGGIVAYDVAGVGTPRYNLAAVGYGAGKALFGFGDSGTWGQSYIPVNITNYVTDNGIISADTTGVGSARYGLAATSYGTDKAIFGFGYYRFPAITFSNTNLVSNTGVVATDTNGVGTARLFLAAAGYGGDKAVFGGGSSDANSGSLGTYNLVDNNGIVLNDSSFATFRQYAGSAASFGQSGAEQAIFSFGWNSSNTSSSTVIFNNNGIPSSEVAQVGTFKQQASGAKL
jgi:hypothetical protein